MILMDFEVLFGRPRGRPGAPFSDLARPEAAKAEKKNGQNVISEALWMHVRVLLGTRSGPKGVFVMKT